MDLVVGSGRKGKSYLYWRDGLLFELPVSYLTGIRGWINSPGYLDGEIDFGRLIQPRCLECHANQFTVEQVAGRLRYASRYELGIGCAKCHGDGTRHVQYHEANPGDRTARSIQNPARFSRERKLDLCALCHGGPREPVQPAFSYRPGEPLESYLVATPASERATPDVHGNQLALLRTTRCFRGSPTMTCSTCHDVHRTERDLTAMAGKCLQCHQPAKHPMARRIGQRMMTECIGCHLPNQPSKAIEINTPTRQFAPAYRSHLIAIYPELSAAILRGADSTRR
jgi:predicted CXXCH cytochrome family protein